MSPTELEGAARDIFFLFSHGNKIWNTEHEFSNRSVVSPSVLKLVISHPIYFLIPYHSHYFFHAFVNSLTSQNYSSTWHTNWQLIFFLILSLFLPSFNGINQTHLQQFTMHLRCIWSISSWFQFSLSTLNTPSLSDIHSKSPLLTKRTLFIILALSMQTVQKYCHSKELQSPWMILKDSQA